MTSGFAALYGSPKQVAWADEIRGGLYALCEREYAAALAAASPGMAAEAARASEQALEAMRGEASAAWWIDSRGETPRSMLDRVAARQKDPNAAKVAELAEAFRCRARTSRFFITASYSFLESESGSGRVYVRAAHYTGTGRLTKTVKCGYVLGGAYVAPQGSYNILEDRFE